MSINGPDLVMSGLGPALAVLFTNPMDVCKVRMQMQNELVRADPSAPRAYKNPVHCLYVVGKTEGMTGLYRGIGVAVIRDGCKCFFRIGLYDPLVDLIHPPANKSKPSMATLMFAGGVTSAIASAMFNPLDLVKTRVQAAGGLSTSHYQYSNSFAALTNIAQNEGGVGALWRGTLINMFRSIMFGSVMLATNSRLKTIMKERALGSAFAQDSACAFVASAAGIMVMNPVDVVRTRLYNQPRGQKALYGDSGNPIRAAMMIARSEGLMAFYKGTVAHWMRVGPNTVISFALIGILKRAYDSFNS